MTWCLKKQPVVALKSTNVEYQTIFEGANKATWLKVLLNQLDVLQTTIPLYVDNQSCMKIAKILVYHIRTKHIKMHYHYIREKILYGKIELTYVIISDQIFKQNY
jgi:hypothetical protein